MKLVSVQVKNYKSIEDSETFTVKDLTCLAGKNESGKTAILQALRRLNPVESSESNYETLTEYPRRRLHEADGEDPAAREVLSTKWELTESDIAAIEEAIGSGAMQDKYVAIRRGYNNQTEWNLSIDDKKVVEFIVSQITELKENSKQRNSSQPTVANLHSQLASSESRDEGEERLLEYINQHFPEANSETKVRTILQERLPHFLYFPTYGTLAGRVQVEELSAKIANGEELVEAERYFLALLALAGTDVNSFSDATRYEQQKARLEGVSNRLTDEMFKYWSQNQNLEVEFDYSDGKRDDPPPFNEGHIISLRVRNNRHRVTVGFDDRSTGFVWFFSFLAWFSRMEETHGSNLIILLDEPGLSLHGKAQGDLLRYIKERLLPKYQVIYTTHSPFMIDTENILGVRTVEDKVTNTRDILGTKVGDRVLSTDADTLFPLRAALGYDLTQSLFIGEHTLLVEGPSDLLYIHWFSRELQERGRTRLDPRWTVTPVGGIDKFGSFNALFGGNELHVAILTDYHQGEKRKVNNLEDSGLLRAGHLFLANQFTDQEEGDIEDLLGRDLYVELVNQCYQLPEAERLRERADHPTTRVLVEVEDHFRTTAIKGPEFDHYTPAVYLTEHASKFRESENAEVGLSRFERFFQSLNELLTT